MISKLLEKIAELREDLSKPKKVEKPALPKENKYLEKVCVLLRPPEAPRSERAIRRPKKIKKPKLRRFTAKINHKNYK